MMKRENYHYPGIDLLKPDVDDSRYEMELERHFIKDVLSDCGISTRAWWTETFRSVFRHKIWIEGVKDCVDAHRVRNLVEEVLKANVRIVVSGPKRSSFYAEMCKVRLAYGEGTDGESFLYLEIPRYCVKPFGLERVFGYKAFRNTTMHLPCAIGKNLAKKGPLLFDLAQMHHLFIGGGRRLGRHFCLHDIIMSLLFKKSPQELKFVLIESANWSFGVYAPLADFFLATCRGMNSIISESGEAVSVLGILYEFMEKRFALLKYANARNIDEYNETIAGNRPGESGYMPRVVVVIDELEEFGTDRDTVETLVLRLIGVSHRVGIHLIITLRCSSFISGCIKANVPARIAFKCNRCGSLQPLFNERAVKLCGMDILFSNESDLVRARCAVVGKTEIEKVVSFIARQKDFANPFILPDA